MATNDSNDNINNNNNNTTSSSSSSSNDNKNGNHHRNDSKTLKNQAGVEQGVGRVEPRILHARRREGGEGRGGGRGGFKLDEAKIRAKGKV